MNFHAHASPFIIFYALKRDLIKKFFQDSLKEFQLFVYDFGAAIAKIFSLYFFSLRQFFVITRNKINLTPI